MPEWLLAVAVPVGVLGLVGGGFWLWARHGTQDPVEHHSSMPDEYTPPDG
ncbi:hypothetical protein [Kitasatospora camelliae]|uniref:Secreted protein with PEP-CTERM sorting signal n=1 Tax=Kitasatospora camelliae TaxID=3156397 RepID=A0AAU8K5F7_9ACTN